MRIDKFLKLIRVIKRRQISKEIIENGRVFINDKLAKPASLVKKSDCITVKLSRMTVVIEVLDSDEKTLKKTPDLCYKIVSELAHEPNTRQE